MRRLALAAVLLAAGACSLTNDLDMEKAESTLRTEVERAYGVPVDTVECPAEVGIEEGASFECTAALAGEELTLVARQDDGEGNVTFEASEAVIDVATKTAELQAAITQANPGGDLRLACGDQSVLVLPPGATFECRLTAPEAPARTVVVTVDDVDGTTSFTTS